MTDTMNPRKWKREHQLALLIALPLGGAAGIAIAVSQVQPQSLFIQHLAYLLGVGNRFDSAYKPLSFFLYWIIIMFWGIVGASIAGALIYIRQLLR